MPIVIDQSGEIIESQPPVDSAVNSYQRLTLRSPGFLIRWGNMIFLLILLTIAILSWFITYPGTVPTVAKLESVNAPKPVIAKMDAKIIRLNASEGEKVEAGAEIGQMESIGQHDQINELSTRLKQLSENIGNTTNIMKFLDVKYSSLGELQTAYQVFIQQLTEYKEYLPGGIYEKRKNALLGDIQNLKIQKINLIEQKNIQEEDNSLSQVTFEKNEILKKEKVISELEYRQEKSKLLNKKILIPQMRSSIISNEDQQHSKQKEILELESTKLQQNGLFIQAVNTLRSYISEWQRKYLLIAPISGTVAFLSVMQENQQLVTNQIICFINPVSTQYFAEMYIPQSNFGKVHEGQDVLLKILAYPSHEFGMVIGKVGFISNLPTDSGYLAKVICPNGLTTNYDKVLQFREGLTASAEIVIEKRNLLQRLYYNLASQLRHR